MKPDLFGSIGLYDHRATRSYALRAAKTLIGRFKQLLSRC